MLSEAHREIVKSTVPLLETGGEALTRHFYRILLDEYPQVRPLFNQAHQHSGEQQRALANGVLMYAKHIDRLDALGPLVGQIVNKHVSLRVLPEHYPIVGTCLLRAIREVLGAEIATDAVLEAWGEAYGLLAGLLTGAEEQAYADAAAQPGGWRGARAFTVSRKEAESEEITSFYLRPADGGAVPDFVPGQYIGLRVVIDGTEHRRNYSLSMLGNGDEYRISVKREPAGQVSNYLHDRAGVGDTLELFPPAGAFTLKDSSRPLALITAGVGITPALSMLEAALGSGRDIHFIHYARHGGAHAFKRQIEDLSARHEQIRHRFCYSEPRHDDQAHAIGFVSESQLAGWLPEHRDIDVYFVGPKPFMSQVKRSLSSLGVPDTQCHYEFFGPASALEE
ncbi:nitric oxide dioxygenase [Solimonas aquatica]|uniref:Flavohemoprotein n=1 Tax=Solimonas aquatica TaxID=489703 RepID=A0A1H9A9C2_9GAMM|nr:NO-inducible flavohemoprotein [Solimonas aquatica]SEP73087.1 nitric oxide dioxygenase [Solimonas aquatica]